MIGIFLIEIRYNSLLSIIFEFVGKCMIMLNALALSYLFCDIELFNNLLHYPHR